MSWYADQERVVSLRESYRNSDQSLEVVCWDDYAQDRTYFVARTTGWNTQLVSTWREGIVTSAVASDIAAELLAEAYPVFPTESAAIQAWCTGELVVCRACCEPLRCGADSWLHHEAHLLDGHAQPVICPSDLELARHRFAPPRENTDARALHMIDRILRVPEWSGADDMAEIDEHVRATGRPASKASQPPADS